MKIDLYQVITDRIIALLESGMIPWRKPWTGGQPPQNLVSRRPYGGVNAFLLNATGYQSPYWLTFKQLQSLGARVRKGEKAFPVVFWKLLKPEEESEKKTIPFLRYHNIFNVEQCENLVAPKVETKSFEPITRCEEVVAQMPQKPEMAEGALAGYIPPLDQVIMPNPTRFESPEAYYSVLFHELTHATGHVSRLSRKEITEPTKFGSDPYSREELVAEMGATFLCGHCQIGLTTLENSAAYLQGWLHRLKDDKKLMLHSAAQAQKAANFILGVKARPEEEAPAVNQPKEYKVVALRECPVPDSMLMCDTPELAADYWRLHVATNPYFNPDYECFVIIMLNTRRKVKGHQVLTIGTRDTLLVDCGMVFRGPIVASASSVVLMHNHPSGDPTPSEADIKVTRDLIRAGQLLKIEVVDHVVLGRPEHRSLRAMGYFY